ncbi:hypothetical protein BS17DRAFT_773223, partial [Gyrodon lividus]
MGISPSRVDKHTLPTMGMRRTSSNVASSESQSEKQAYLHQNHAHALSTKEVDSGPQIVAGLSGDLDPVESACVRRKIDFYIQ